MNSNGKGRRINLTNHPAVDQEPTWSPDGTKIAFATNRDGNFEVYVVNADNGANAINLTNNSSSNEFEPNWSAVTG